MKMKFVLFVTSLTSMLLCVSCTDEEHSEQVLRGAGYTDIEMTGYQFTGCSEDDQIHDVFKATGPSGRVVFGTVCCGSLWTFGSKQCTIRIE